MNKRLLDNPRHCAQCGTVLSAYALAEVCGNCLLKPGLAPLPEPLDEPADETRFPALGAVANCSSHAEVVGRFGDYELMEEIARGGMGVVYRARQVSLGRIVAVKMLLAGPLATKGFVQRFRTESAAAASLQHPNIVAIHEVGFAQGQHFFAMDFVEGLTLAQLVAKGPLTARQAATYLKTIAEAIHFAHERNVLHRDLKPSNVLIDSATNQPRVTDFGLAKRFGTDSQLSTQDSQLTLTGQALGSPNFMPPEQAGSQRGKVGRHSDVYGLGAILYHLLTARPPFVAETIPNTLRQVIESEPVSPRLLNPGVPRDLETLCLKCLEKEPGKRYATAQALADELGRFLRNEPIEARPVSRFENVWRWCRRKPAIASLGASLVLVFVLGFTGTLWQWRQAMHNAEAEAKQRQRAEENLYAADMHGVETALDDGDLGRAKELLEAHVPRAGQTDLRGFEWRLFWQRCRGDDLYALRGHSISLNELRFSPDGDTLATRSLDNHLKVWDLTTRAERFTITNVTRLGAFTSDGLQFACGMGDGSVRLVEARTGRTLHSLEKAGELVALLPDGKIVATTSEAFIVKLSDITSGDEPYVLPGKGGLNSWTPEFGVGIAITPDRKRLAIRNGGLGKGLGKGITLWDLATHEIVNPSLDIRTNSPLTFLVLSPDGKVLATGGFNGLVRLWDMATGDELLPPLPAHSEPVVSAAFSPDGQVLATASMDQTIKLWDFATRRELDTLKGHESGVRIVAFSPNGLRLASGGADKTVRLWNTEKPVKQQAFPGLAETYPVKYRLIWSPDSKLLAGRCQDHTVKLWDAATFETRSVVPGADRVLAFSDNKTILVSFGDGTTKYCDVATGKVTGKGPSGPLGNWTSMVVSSDRRSAAIVDHTPTIQLWDIVSGKIRLLAGRTKTARAVAISTNGLTVISGGDEGVVDICDVARGQCVASIAAHSERVVSLAISPDGTIAASGSVDCTVKLWNLKTRSWLATLTGHKEPVWALAFSPDGKTLASGSGDHSIRLWNVSFRREVAVLRRFTTVPESIHLLNFSPDGNTLAAVTGDGELTLLRAATLDEATSHANAAPGAPNAVP